MGAVGPSSTILFAEPGPELISRGGRTDPPPMGSERAGTPATTWTTLCGGGNDHGRPGPKKVSPPFWGRGATVMMRAFFSSPEERMAVWPSTDDDAFIGSTR